MGCWLRTGASRLVSVVMLRNVIFVGSFQLNRRLAATTAATGGLRPQSPFPTVLGMSPKESATALEIEEKFQLTAGSEAVEDKLQKLGFVKNGQVTRMVDWYFDLPAPSWTLTPRDSWLRFRETDKGSGWQLKRGRSHEGGATVYEELEGNEAIESALSMLLPTAQQKFPTETEYEGHVIPTLPRPADLVPFARIETTRSSWSPPDEETGEFRGLVVDLDSTQYGYAVGEVECVVYSEDEIQSARERIHSLVAELVPENDASNSPAIGKLESYLIMHKPDHYEACINGGSIQRR